MSSGDKSMEKSKGELLDSNGIAVAAANYGLVPDTFLNGQIYHGKAAIRWMRANAGTYGIDPNRIGVAGGSAGAIIASTLAMTCGHPELEGDVGENDGVSSCVSAAVLLAGVYSLPDYFLIEQDGRLTSGGIRNQIKACAIFPPDATPEECLQDGDANNKGDFYHCYLNQPDCLHALNIASARYNVTPDDPDVFMAVGADDETPGWFIDQKKLYDALVAAIGADSVTWHIETTLGCTTHGSMWSCIDDLVVTWLRDHL
jgi:hypothetical protein